MNFIEAHGLMNENSKLRMKTETSSLIYKVEDSVLYYYNEYNNVWDTSLYGNGIIMVDWKIIEKKKKTLSICRNQLPDNSNWWYHEEDVKAALKEFFNWFDESLNTNKTCREKAKEIFGDVLID